MYKILAKPFFIGKRVVYMPSCHSTNEEASKLVKSRHGLDGTIVVTDSQTAGKGQQGNTWESAPGQNLTFSVILHPKNLSVRNHFVLNIIVSLAVRDFVASHCHGAVKVKWPNDIYVENEKIAGILIANTLKGSMIEKTIIGIGLNINQVDFEIKNATSLKLVSGVQYLLPECLEGMILNLEKYYLQLSRGEYEQLMQHYQRHMYWLGTVKTFEDEGVFFSGIIRGIDKEGKLHIEKENEDAYYTFKEVRFVK